MKIDLIGTHGSPLKVIPLDIEQRGVGGSELAMMTLMQTFSERGHSVRVYNNPRAPGTYNGVEYHHHRDFRAPEPRDAVILFRAPNPMVDHRTSGLKIWWSCDQWTIGDYPALGRLVDRIVCISPHHRQYFLDTYHIDAAKITVLDLGVRLQEYVNPPERVRNRMIYCSMPDRGLEFLLPAYQVIRQTVPDATLSITADYRMWDAPANNERHRLAWAGQPGVTFYGLVPRSQLVRLQMEAELQPYPCVYDELFCISVAECQVAGAMPVTTEAGALPTTNTSGIIIPGVPGAPKHPGNTDYITAFASRVAGLLSTDRQYMDASRAKMMETARRRFDWNVIAAQWEDMISNGKANP
jgi:glycosyltransferase involved in cell wall biosynthesis